MGLTGQFPSCQPCFSSVTQEMVPLSSGFKDPPFTETLEAKWRCNGGTSWCPLEVAWACCAPAVCQGSKDTHGRVNSFKVKGWPHDKSEEGH